MCFNHLLHNCNDQNIKQLFESSVLSDIRISMSDTLTPLLCNWSWHSLSKERKVCLAGSCTFCSSPVPELWRWTKRKWSLRKWSLRRGRCREWSLRPCQEVDESHILHLQNDSCHLGCWFATNVTNIKSWISIYVLINWSDLDNTAETWRALSFLLIGWGDNIPWAQTYEEALSKMIERYGIPNHNFLILTQVL